MEEKGRRKFYMLVPSSQHCTAICRLRVEGREGIGWDGSRIDSLYW
jgi:hypothetical protein